MVDSRPLLLLSEAQAIAKRISSTLHTIPTNQLRRPAKHTRLQPLDLVSARMIFRPSTNIFHALTLNTVSNFSGCSFANIEAEKLSMTLMDPVEIAP
jgi:hypothetical protein